ncbi:glycosyltransferase [Anaerobaca lacustris]|uniref:Glycosyltransferase n=1 Tax=Anaerobaca lacustris TaxID=3044600 RepID=A0AAW6TYJ7_9BACT|nr:glycosyltransferase [Sedimentisphaerales bacterium M17dextr]
MIFLTVGTQFPFDRLVQAVDEFFDEYDLDDEIYAQIGSSAYRPRHFEAVPTLDKEAFDRRFREANAIIGHAGMGTIMLAFDCGKPLLAMPRRKKYGEVVNDHQVALADEFEALGHILVAHNASELSAKLTRLKSFAPQRRVASPEAVAERIRCFVKSIDRRK